MKSIKGIVIGVVLFGIIATGIFLWQANQKVVDPATLESEASYRASDLFTTPEEALIAMEGKNVTITGIVWANEGDDLERTITLGTDDFNSIICQIDNRYLQSMSNLPKGQVVLIQGTITGHDFDDVLGKTIQMKNCIRGNY